MNGITSAKKKADTIFLNSTRHKYADVIGREQLVLREVAALLSHRLLGVVTQPTDSLLCVVSLNRVSVRCGTAAELRREDSLVILLAFVEYLSALSIQCCHLTDTGQSRRNFYKQLQICISIYVVLI